MTNPKNIIKKILGDKVSKNKLEPPKPTISTVDGKKKFVKRITDEQLSAGNWAGNGYWIIHHGDMHDVYR